MMGVIGVIIDQVKARTLLPGWETEILLHGDIFNMLDVLLMDMDVKRIHDILDSGGEIEFRCWSTASGASEAFIKTLERPAGMPSDNHGGLKSRSERIKDFEVRNQTIRCQNHGRIKCADCPVP